MMTRRNRNNQSLLAWLLAITTTTANATVFITEISDKGTSGVCDGNDWIELYNGGTETVDLSQGYILHDDKGMDDVDAFRFPSNTLLGSQEFMLLCTQLPLLDHGEETGDAPIDLLPGHPLSPPFGIGGDDTITLLQELNSTTTETTTTTETVAQQRQSVLNSNYVIVSQVALPNTDDGFDITYAWNPETGFFDYTSTPTPGTANIMTALPTPEEVRAQLKAELTEQNALGTQFFNMDDRGYMVDNGMDMVLQMSVTMDPADYQYVLQNRTFEQYRPFMGGDLQTLDGTPIATFGQGDIRSKGQSSLYFSTCLGTKTFPFQMEFSGNTTLFGMKRFYLRTHVGDNSYMRDHAYNRMLARFGLPFLRTRKVLLSINNVKHGYYTLMEAPDQDYVFHRSFPDFDPENYAMFKVKSYAFECGSYTQDEIAQAEARLAETSSPPYAFQRGEHKVPPKELGLALDECIEQYDENMWERDYIDVVLAWLRHDRSCADMLMEEGQIDRDLGNNNFDDAMHDFIEQEFRHDDRCEPSCSNSNLVDMVDTDNWLKNFAFYAVTMNADSPLINGNNYFLAQSGEEAFGGTGGWKIVGYDYNLAEVTYCHEVVCNERIVHWSIARPTCESLESNNIAGPLLTDETLFAKYLEYVEEFTETVYGNASFIAELQEHAQAQEQYVRQDFWSILGIFYNKELSPDAAEWDSDTFPLLPIMKARTEDVRAQLSAIKDGTFPRGPFVGTLGNNEPLEYCPDWRLTEPNTTTCELGCEYEGCAMSGWTVEYFCDEETGTCIHGDYDEQCRNLFDGSQYPGMQPTEDGRDTFCRFARGIPIKAAECPAVGAVKTSGSAAASFYGRGVVQIVSTVVVAMVALFGL